MGFRAFAERLLRPSTLTCIAPPSRLAPSWSAQRCLSDTTPNPAARPAPHETPEAATTPEVAAASPQPTPSSSSSSSTTTTTTTTTSDAASQAIDSLFAAPAQATADATPDTAAAAATPAGRYDHVFGASFSKPSRGRLARTPKLNFTDMMMTDDLANPSLANKPKPSTLAAQQTATFENYPRLNPTYGRTVNLDASRGRDIVRGIGMLASLMARNKVKSDFNKQRFHERGGLKRKRLNSERWRARFKQGFRDVTGRVMELTRKGW